MAYVIILPHCVISSPQKNNVVYANFRRRDCPLENALFLQKVIGYVPSCNRQNWLRFVYNDFKSCDQSLDKTSLEFSNIFHAMQSCAMNAKSSIIAKLPMAWSRDLKLGKTNLIRLGLWVIRNKEMISQEHGQVV